MTDAQKLNKFIESRQNILIMASPNKKLDTLGSAAALYHILTDLNKNTTIYFAGSLPQQLNFLGLKSFVSEHINPSIVWDGVIIIGCNYANPEAQEWKNSPVDIRIVPSLYINGNMGAIRSDERTSEIITKLLQELDGAYITPRVATALLAGLIASTNNFQEADCKPQSLFTAAYLTSKKARKDDIIRHLYKTKPIEFIKLWGYMLAKFSYDENDKIAWSAVDEYDFASAGASRSHAVMLVTELRNNFSQADIFILGIEKTNKEFVALIHSWRPELIKQIGEHLNLQVKNSSIIVPITPSRDILNSTESLVSALKKILTEY